MRDLLDSFSMIMIIVVVMELALLGLGIHSYDLLRQRGMSAILMAKR